MRIIQGLYDASLRIIENFDVLLVISNTDNGRLELPGRDLAVEQDISLAVRTVLELRKAEVCQDPADDGSSAPDVAAFSSDVPSGRVQELRSQVNHGDLGNVVGCATDGSRQRTKTDSGGLGNDGIGDGAKSTSEDEGDQDTQDGLSIIGSARLLDRSADAEDDQEGNVGGGTPEVDGAATEPSSQRPRENVGDELQARVDKVQVEGAVVAHASLLKEESSLVGNQVTGEVLRGVHQASDGGTSEVDALEQVEKGGRAAQLRLNLDGTLDHSIFLLVLLNSSIRRTKALDGAKCLVLAAAADEPPW